MVCLHQINCNGCGKIYIGKTERDIQTRAKGHIINITIFFKLTYQQSQLIFGKHTMDLKPKLLKPVNDKIELETWKNIKKINKDRALNFEIPPADILIKKFILQSLRGDLTVKERVENERKGLLERTIWNSLAYVAKVKEMKWIRTSLSFQC